MARYCHDPLVVPAFPDFSRHKGMAEIMEVETNQTGLPTRRFPRPLPALPAERFSLPGKHMPADRGHLALALVQPNLREYSPQGRGDRDDTLVFRLGVHRTQPHNASFHIHLVPGQLRDFPDQSFQRAVNGAVYCSPRDRGEL